MLIDRTDERIDRLIVAELSVTDVCFRSGFFNVSNFNRRFREVQGAFPSSFLMQAVRAVILALPRLRQDSFGSFLVVTW